MPLQFYAANGKSSGGALSVSFNSKDRAVYFNLIKQVSWDANTKKGTFKGGKQLNFKLSLDEVGSIIHTIRTNGNTKFFHSFGDSSTTGNFNYFLIKSTDPKFPDRQGFGLSLKNGTDEFKVALSLGGATNLMEYLVFALNHCYSALYASDKKSNEEYLKKKAAEKTSPAPTQKADATEPTVEAGGQDNADDLF